MTPDPRGSYALMVRTIDAIRALPLWLLVAIALSLTVFDAVPEFLALAPGAYKPAVLFALVVAWIVVLAKATSVIFDALANRHGQESFVVTPVVGQCHWGISKQADGSFVTQFSLHCMVKNRTSAPLHLMRARIVKPKISGEELPGILTIQAPDSHMHETAYVSGYNIPAGQTLPASATILFRGMPKQRAGHITALVRFHDADANRITIPVKFTMMGMAGPPRTCAPARLVSKLRPQ